MNFKIIEGENVDMYDEMKQDYLNGIIDKDFREKWGIGTTAYKTLLKRFREDGIVIRRGRRKKQ